MGRRVTEERELTRLAWNSLAVLLTSNSLSLETRFHHAQTEPKPIRTNNCTPCTTLQCSACLPPLHLHAAASCREAAIRMEKRVQVPLRCVKY